MHDVESVVEELADRDEAGLVVAACWYDVADDRPNYLMSQFDVQNFLWLTLPQLVRDPPGDLDSMPDWRAVVEEAAWFFERLDQPRYAAICRSSQTREILSAAHDRVRCFELYAKATHESGLMPPSALRVTWLDDPGPREVALYDAITRTLERAIVSGGLDPADESERLRTAVAVLDQLPDGHTETLQDLLLAERMERWRCGCDSQTMRELLVRTEPDVSKPLDLNLEVLLAGARPFGKLLDDPGRTWSAPLRAVAQKFGLLEAVDGEPRRTEDGDRALSHPVLVFESVCNGLLHTDDRIGRQAVAPLFAMLLLAETVDTEMLVDRVGVVLYEMGWRGNGHDEPVPAETVRSTVTDLLDDMRVAGCLDDDRLTPFGLRVVLAGLRMRAMEGGVVE